MLVIDIEATGTNPQKHSIVSLGALDLRDPENQLYLECRVWDDAHIDPDGLAVCGYSEAEVTDVNKMSEGELIRNFLGWADTLPDRTLAGQNVAFDRAFVEAACARAGESFPFPHRTIDTHSLAYMHMVARGIEPPFDAERRRSALNLDAVLAYCGVPEEPTPHNALTGAKCHAEAVARLLYGTPLLPEFVAYSIPFTRERC